MIKKILRFSSSSVFSQVLILLFTPLLARIYSPYEFGSFGLATAIFSILCQITGLRLEQSLIVSSPSSAKWILFTSSCFSLFFSLVSFVVLSFFYNVSFSFFISVIAFGSFCYNTLINFYIKLNRVRLSANLMIVRALLMIAFQVLFGIFDVVFFEVNGLILGYFFCVVIFPFVIFFEVRHCRWNFIKVRALFRFKTSYIKYNFPQTILNNIGAQLPVFAIEFFWGKEILGFYTMALKVVQLPVRFVGNSIRAILTNELSKYRCSHLRMIQMTREYTKYLMLISVFIFLGLYFLSDFVFKYFLGEAWGESAGIVKVLILWFFISLLNIPSLCFLVALDKLGFLFKVEVLSLCMKVFVFSVPYFFLMDVYGVLWMFSLLMFLVNFYIICFSCFFKG